MNDERDETIDENELPEAGNSNARLYPPVEDAPQGGNEQEDEQQPSTGDAAAVRDGGPELNDAA